MPNNIDDLRRMAATEPNLALREGYLEALADAESMHKAVSGVKLIQDVRELTETLDQVLDVENVLDYGPEGKGLVGKDKEQFLLLLRQLKVRIEAVLDKYPPDERSQRNPQGKMTPGGR